MSTGDYSESDEVAARRARFDHSAFPMRPFGLVNFDYLRQIAEWDSKHGTQPLELEASTTEQLGPPEPSETIEGLTIAKAATANGLLVSSIRRLISWIYKL